LTDLAALLGDYAYTPPHHILCIVAIMVLGQWNIGCHLSNLRIDHTLQKKNWNYQRSTAVDYQLDEHHLEKNGHKCLCCEIALLQVHT
jgi:hypothetical protein